MTQPLEPTLATFQNPFARYFAATRPAFLTASMMACVIGMATPGTAILAFDIALALVTLLFALLAQAGVNVLNDYYDALNGTDAQNTDRIFPFTGGSRFIQNGVMTPSQTRIFGFALFAGVALAGTMADGALRAAIDVYRPRRFVHRLGLFGAAVSPEQPRAGRVVRDSGFSRHHRRYRFCAAQRIF